MTACSTTQSRPTPPCAVPHADARVPASRSSPPARSTPGTGGRAASPDPNPVRTPVPAGRPHPPRCHETEAVRCPHHRPAPGAYPATTHDTPTMLEAAEVLLRAGKGDPGAWQDIIRRYSGVVFAKVRTFRLQDADTLDAVQMTWLRLAENIHRIQHPERLSGWLATTAARECLHILHHARHTPTPTDTVVDTLADPAASPEQRIIDAETAQTLRKLVAELPPRRRKLLQALFTDHPPPYAELAANTGIPIGSIGPTRNRALHQLRHMLENHQPTPPGVANVG
jgi:RNA polymerase sigma factor (sigma-70 family)